MAKLAFNPAFDDLDPSEPGNVRLDDPKWHQKAMRALRYWYESADSYRQRAKEQVVDMAAYRNNVFLAKSDTVSEESRATHGVALKQPRKAKKLRRYYSVPAVIGAAERRKAMYGKMALDFEASRLTTTDDDLVVAEVMQNHANRVEKPALEDVKWVFVDKVVWELRTLLKVWWDVAGGSDLGLRGVPAFRPLGPLEYFIDPACGWRGVAGARYVGDQAVVDAGEVFERYATDSDRDKGNAKRLTNWEHWGKDLVLSSEEAQIWGLKDMATQSSVASTCVLADVYFRPAPGLKLPNGLHAIYILPTSGGDSGGKFEDGLVLRWEPWKHTPPYIDDAVEVMNPQYYFGDAYARLTGPLNKAMNFQLMAANAIAENNAKQLLFQTGGEIGETAFKSAQQLGKGASMMVDGLIYNPDPNVQLGWMGQSGAALQLRMFDMFTQGIGLVTNSAPNAQPAPELATQAQRAMLYEASVMGVVKERVSRAILKACLLGMQWSQRYNTTADLRKMLPEQGESELSLFKKADLVRNTQVKLRQSTFFSGNVEARLTFAHAIAQMDPSITRKYIPDDNFRELLNTRDEVGPSEWDRAQECAEAENGRLKKDVLRSKTIDPKTGKTVMAVLPDEGVLDTDNHDAHIAVHKHPLDDPNRHLMDPGFKRRLLNHIAWHEQKRAARLKSDAVNQVMAAQGAEAVLGEIGAGKSARPMQPGLQTPPENRGMQQ